MYGQLSLATRNGAGVVFMPIDINPNMFLSDDDIDRCVDCKSSKLILCIFYCVDLYYNKEVSARTASELVVCCR